VIGQLSVYRPDWMRKPNCVVNDCCETDADEEQMMIAVVHVYKDLW